MPGLKGLNETMLTKFLHTSYINIGITSIEGLWTDIAPCFLACLASISLGYSGHLKHCLPVVEKPMQALCFMS